MGMLPSDFAVWQTHCKWIKKTVVGTMEEYSVVKNRNKLLMHGTER